MHLEKPILARYLSDPSLKGYTVLQKIFFASTEPSQAAGGAFIERLAQRRDDRDLASGPGVAAAQISAVRGWEKSSGEQLSLNSPPHLGPVREQTGQELLHCNTWPQSSCRGNTRAARAESGRFNSGDVKGTIADAVRYRFVPNDVRRHRLISISYITLLPCHGRGRGFESRRPRHSF